MRTKKLILAAIVVLTIIQACKPLAMNRLVENKNIPKQYDNKTDTSQAALKPWRSFFKDTLLVQLIDSALQKNQELKIFSQEVKVAENEVLARKAAYLPMADMGAGAGLDKHSRYSTEGAFDANNDILPGTKVPDPLPHVLGVGNAIWEIDVWKKLHNAKNSAMHQFYATQEGRHLMVTNLVAEVAETYYDLLALDNQMSILKSTIELYRQSLEIVKLEKLSARVTELAVRRFEAELLRNQSKQFYLSQQIVQTQNRLNFLLGRFPQNIIRKSDQFLVMALDTIHTGEPSQLLINRPDIRKAEQELAASKLDVRVARAQFYPSLVLSAGTGLTAFSPAYLLHAPQSLLWNLGGAVFAPVINRKVLKANLFTANARQTRAVVSYERSVLAAYTEVVNQLSNIDNLQKSFDLKQQQVQTLTTAIDISNTLFKSARADYMEVLLTQRDALDAKFELVETKKQQADAMINLYKALGGGWR